MSDEQKITVDEDVNLGPGFDLYRVNDALTTLASTLGVKWASDEAEDEALNTATYAVAEAFGLRDPEADAEPAAVVLVGTLSDGYRAFGPFGDFNQAAEWADFTRTTATGEPSWVMTLNEAQAGSGA